MQDASMATESIVITGNFALKLTRFQPVMDWWQKREEIEADGWSKAKCYTAEEIAAGGYNLDLCGFPHEEEEILDPLDLIQSYQEHRKELNAEIDRVLGEITRKLASGNK